MDKLGELFRKSISLFYFPTYISMCFFTYPILLCTNAINKSLTRVISRMWTFSTFVFVKIMFVKNIRLFYNPSILNLRKTLLISNHVNNLDWIILWMSLTCIKRKNIIFNAKNTTFFYGSMFKLLNNFGTDFVFLKRNINYDYITLVESCKDISKKEEFVSVLFPEGTLLCKKKSKFVNFQRALHRNMEIPNKTLVPKTTGFKIIMENLHENIQGLIDCTIIYRDPVGIMAFFKGERTCADVYLNYIDKPTGNYEDFLMNLFAKKDKELEDGIDNKNYLNINISSKQRYKYICTLAIPWFLSKLKKKR